MSLDERFSAWLDGELDESEISHLEAQLAADEELAAAFDALRSIRATIRSEAMMPMPMSSLGRIMVAVEAVDGVDVDGGEPVSPVETVPVSHLTRRRAPTLAAAAASFAIIVSVVGGLGGTSTLPAVGDHLARHEAAAVDLPTMGVVPMEDTLSMPSSLEVAHRARIDDDVVHAVYVSGTSSVVSVFRQDGALDLDGLVDEMNGGETTEMAGHPTWAKDVGRHHITVIGANGYVWTVITAVDEPMESMMDVMDDLPSREADLHERLHDVAEAIVEPFGLGF